MTDEDRGLYERAVAAAAFAYAPYSGFGVGAAVRARDGRTFVGANVENAAYPLGLCAEQAALARAAGEGCRPGDLTALAVTAPPCGGCRQWLLEFRVERVVYPDDDGELLARPLSELLPDGFSP